MQVRGRGCPAGSADAVVRVSLLPICALRPGLPLARTMLHAHNRFTDHANPVCVHRPICRTSPQVAASIMRQKVIASSGDKVAVMLYGTVSTLGLLHLLWSATACWRAVVAAAAQRCGTPLMPPPLLTPPRALTPWHGVPRALTAWYGMPAALIPLHVLLQREESTEYGGMESTWLLQDLEEPGADGIQALENFRREQFLDPTSGCIGVRLSWEHVRHPGPGELQA